MLELSHDAKSLFTATFGRGVTELAFGFVHSRPSARCNAALAELEFAGIVTRTVERDRARIVYRLTERIPEKTARRLRVPESKLADICIAEPNDYSEAPIEHRRAG